MQDWQPISLAPVDEVVMTKIDDADGVRNEQPLIRQGTLWYFPDKSMYVYYTPTHWRRIVDQPPLSGREKSTLANLYERDDLDGKFLAGGKCNMRQHENLRELCQAIEASGQPVARIAQRAKCREQTIYYWLNRTTYCGQHRKMADVAQALGLSWRLLRANSSSRG